MEKINVTCILDAIKHIIRPILQINCSSYIQLNTEDVCTVPLRCSQNKAWTSRPHGSGFVSVVSHNSMREMKAAKYLKFS